MATKPKRPRDTNQLAKLIVDISTGEPPHVDAKQQATSFCYSKQKNVPANKIGEAGDILTWAGMCADTKLVISWLVGGRDADYAESFMGDLASRLKNRVQLTTDGHKAYLSAVENAFGSEVDYAMLVKLYGAAQGNQQERRYSAGECCGTIRVQSGR